MSEFLRAARDKVQSAVEDIDRAIASFEGQLTQLRSYREHLLGVLNGDGASASSAPPVPAKARGGRHAKVAAPRKPAPPTVGASVTRAAPETGVTQVDAANRLKAFLEKKGQVDGAAAFAATRLPNKGAFKRLIDQLILAKLIVRTGKVRGTRYSLPGQSVTPAAAAEGD